MAGSLELISRTTLGSSAASIAFTSIPSTYTDLKLVVTVIPSAAYVGFGLMCNNNSTSALYSSTRLYADGASVTSTLDTGGFYGFALLTDGYPPTSNPYLITVDLLSYSGTTYKAILSSSSADGNGSGRMNKTVSRFGSTSAITRLDALVAASGSFAAGTTASLYGIKG